MADKLVTGLFSDEVLKVISEIYQDYEEVVRSKSGGPASYIKLKDGKGKIGFISAIDVFCRV